MSKIIIIGAGAMGSAFSLPCLDNNHDVSIIGTHLENEFSKYKTYLKTYIHGFKINLVDPTPPGINDHMKEYLKLE